MRLVGNKLHVAQYDDTRSWSVPTQLVFGCHGNSFFFLGYVRD